MVENKGTCTSSGDFTRLDLDLDYGTGALGLEGFLGLGMQKFTFTFLSVS